MPDTPKKIAWPIWRNLCAELWWDDKRKDPPGSREQGKQSGKKRKTSSQQEGIDVDVDPQDEQQGDEGDVEEVSPAKARGAGACLTLLDRSVVRSGERTKAKRVSAAYMILKNPGLRRTSSRELIQDVLQFEEGSYVLSGTCRFFKPLETPWADNPYSAPKVGSYYIPPVEMNNEGTWVSFVRMVIDRSKMPPRENNRLEELDDRGVRVGNPNLHDEWVSSVGRKLVTVNLMRSFLRAARVVYPTKINCFNNPRGGWGTVVIPRMHDHASDLGTCGPFQDGVHVVQTSAVAVQATNEDDCPVVYVAHEVDGDKGDVQGSWINNCFPEATGIVHVWPNNDSSSTPKGIPSMIRSIMFTVTNWNARRFFLGAQHA